MQLAPADAGPVSRLNGAGALGRRGAQIVADGLGRGGVICPACGEKGITGNLVTLSSANTVLADASRASLTATETPEPDPDASNDATGGDVTVEARNDNYQTLFAGGLNFGLSMGIGASLAVLVSDNDVRARAHDINAFGDAGVTAANDEHLISLNVNAGGSGKTAVELGASVHAISSRVNAEVASSVVANNGRFDLKANNTTDLIDVSVALAGAAKVAAKEGGSDPMVYQITNVQMNLTGNDALRAALPAGGVVDVDAVVRALEGGSDG